MSKEYPLGSLVEKELNGEADTPRSDTEYMPIQIGSHSTLIIRGQSIFWVSEEKYGRQNSSYTAGRSQAIPFLYGGALSRE